MAECKCSVTPRYESDLSKLNGTISTSLTKAVGCQGDIASALGKASDNLCEALAFNQSASSVSSTLGKAAKTLKDAENTASGDRGSEAGRLSGELAALKAEDKKYHDALLAAARSRANAASTRQNAESTASQGRFSANRNVRSV